MYSCMTSAPSVINMFFQLTLLIHLNSGAEGFDLCGDGTVSVSPSKYFNCWLKHLQWCLLLLNSGVLIIFKLLYLRIRWNIAIACMTALFQPCILSPVLDLCSSASAFLAFPWHTPRKHRCVCGLTQMASSSLLRGGSQLADCTQVIHRSWKTCCDTS